MADVSLSDLAEDFRLKAYEFLREAVPLIAPYTVKIIVTYRDDGAQTIAFQNGKSNAEFGESPHNCEIWVNGNNIPAARAFDFAVFYKGVYLKLGTEKPYAILGQLAVDLDMEWGGNWTLEKDGCQPDYDHIQQANWKTA